MSRVSAIDDIEESKLATRELPPEALANQIALHSLHENKKRSVEQGKEIHKRQEEIRFLQKILQCTNQCTDHKSGKLDLTHPHLAELEQMGDNVEDPEFHSLLELRKLLQEAEKKGYRVTFKESYTKEERESMCSNIRAAAEDLTLQNELAIQQARREVEEGHQLLQMAKSISRTSHDAKRRMIQGIASRG